MLLWWILLLVEVELKSRGEGERLDLHPATFFPCNTALISYKQVIIGVAWTASMSHGHLLAVKSCAHIKRKDVHDNPFFLQTRESKMTRELYEMYGKK